MMRFNKYSGSITIKEKTFELDLKASIEPENSLYIGVDGRPGLNKLTIFIKPFTPQMLEKYGYKLERNVVYEFSGSHVGYISSGADGPDGVRETWSINRVQMVFQYFRNGVRGEFHCETERGSSTYLGSLDESTIDKYEPMQFLIELFVPIEKLLEFLSPEITKTCLVERNMKFIEQLKASGLSNYEIRPR